MRQGRFACARWQGCWFVKLLGQVALSGRGCCARRRAQPINNVDGSASLLLVGFSKIDPLIITYQKYTGHYQAEFYGFPWVFPGFSRIVPDVAGASVGARNGSKGLAVAPPRISGGLMLDGKSSVAAERVAEFRARAQRIQRRMRERGLDAMIVTSPTNVWYVTGFWEFIPIRMEMAVIPADGDCAFLVSKNEHEYASKTSWIGDVRYYTEFPEAGRRQNPHDLLAEVIAEKGLAGGVIGIEESTLALADYRRLGEVLPRARLVDSSDVLRGLRMVKSAYEVDMLKRAGKVAVAAWQASLHFAKPGVQEYEVAQAARQAATEMAASLFTADDANHSPLTDGVQLIQSGTRSSISHGRGSPNRLRRGDMVAMCFCMTNQFKGYRVGFSRNFALSEPTAEMVKVYDLIYRAQQTALAEIRPGVPASRLDAMVRAIIQEAGYGEHIEHRLGRGVGLDIAEAPDLKEGDDTPLEPGMTLSVEPAIYITDQWGVQIEDSIVVTPTGYEYLTVAPEPELPVL
jgi:Xaa-Pro aminopeptidase